MQFAAVLSEAPYSISPAWRGFRADIFPPFTLLMEVRVSDAGMENLEVARRHNFNWVNSTGNVYILPGSDCLYFSLALNFLDLKILKSERRKID